MPLDLLTAHRRTALAVALGFVLALGSAGSARAGVSLRVGVVSYEVGTPSFFYCFASTVSANLEPKGWGSRFPLLLNQLSARGVAPHQLRALRAELVLVQAELSHLPPSRVVWDFKRREAKPPWGSNISRDITSLGNYFVTSDGKDLFEVLFSALSEAEHSRTRLQLQ